MKKKLLAIAIGAAVSLSALSATSLFNFSGLSAGLTLQSNIGSVDVYCGGKKGPESISSTPTNFPWFLIMGIFGSSNLQCQFYPDGVAPNSSNEIGSADLTINNATTGIISNIQTYNGHTMPVITYSDNGCDKPGAGCTGIAVALNQ